MKAIYPRLISALIILGVMFGTVQRTHACDRSSLTLDSVTPAPGGTYYIYLRLCVGAGILGLLKGADGNTGRFLFSFSSSDPSFLVTSFTTPITSDFTGVPYSGVNVGAQPAFNASQAIFYNNTSNWFACITSTIACGTVNTECDQIRFQVTTMPDSIRIYGIEGGDNLFGGCYPNVSMLVDFSGLPVEYQDFAARETDGGIQLDWSTLNEYNSSGFQVLRSPDGIQYTDIGFVATQADQAKVGSYQYFDAHPALGTNYYRLRQVDVDGATTESKTVAAHFQLMGEVTWKSIFPNPANNWVNVSFKARESEAMKLELTDLQGRAVVSQEIAAEQGTNEATLSVSGLAPGLYMLQLRYKAGILTEKLVIQ